MKTLERSADITSTARDMDRATKRKSSPTTSYLPLNGLSEVTFTTGYDAEAALPCHTADPDLFFSEITSEINQAKSLCGGCPVARQCLEGALSRVEPCGVWGGQLLDNGRVVAAKRRAGRPRIHTQDESQRIEQSEILEPLRSILPATKETLSSIGDVREIYEAERLERAS